MTSVIQRDLIQVIADESVLAVPRRKWLSANIQSQLVPLYIVVLFWSGVETFQLGMRSCSAITCLCDDQHDFATIPGYISILHETNGLKKELNTIRKIKMNFRGRKLCITPDAGVDGRWESKWRPVFNQFPKIR